MQRSLTAQEVSFFDLNPPNDGLTLNGFLLGTNDFTQVMYGAEIFRQTNQPMTWSQGQAACAQCFTQGLTNINTRVVQAAYANGDSDIVLWVASYDGGPVTTGLAWNPGFSFVVPFDDSTLRPALCNASGSTVPPNPEPPTSEPPVPLPAPVYDCSSVYVEFGRAPEHWILLTSGKYSMNEGNLICTSCFGTYMADMRVPSVPGTQPGPGVYWILTHLAIPRTFDQTTGQVTADVHMDTSVKRPILCNPPGQPPSGF